MAPASTLTPAEVRIIKGMLALRPRITNQQILSYFSRPKRDLNHRVIAEIHHGLIWHSERPASLPEVLVYMYLAEDMQPFPATAVVNAWGPVPGRITPVYLLLDWWSAGQGLFASGTLALDSGARFTWVFDCGTVSNRTILDGSINCFVGQQDALGTASINLAVLSHFDTDHLSGLVSLLGHMRIKTLLLPYVPLWQRLLIAIETGVGADDPAFDFFVDPSAYISAVSDGRIEQIVFVSPTGPDDIPTAPEDGSGPPDGSYFDGPFVAKIEDGDPPDEEARSSQDRAAQGIPIRYLKKAGKIVVPGVWEFVPYNDASLAHKFSHVALERVRILSQIFLRHPRFREAALQRMKKIYEGIFPTGGERNRISLFLYSGPVGDGPVAARISDGPREIVELARPSQLHTGDGYLTLGAAYDSFERFYNPHGRLAKVGIFQVMHHGSRGSWHPGIAAKLAPVRAIFSSDPNGHFKHPHAEVLRDFWSFGPVQVDRHNRFWVQGCLMLRR